MSLKAYSLQIDEQITHLVSKAIGSKEQLLRIIDQASSKESSRLAVRLALQAHCFLSPIKPDRDIMTAVASTMRE